MRLGLFTLQYKYLSLEDAFKDAKDFGYDFIELWGGRPHGYTYDLLKGKLNYVLDLSKQYHIPIEVFTPEHNDYPFNYLILEGKAYNDCLKYFFDSIKVTKALGAKYMLISGSHGRDDMSYDLRWDKLVKTMKEVSKCANDNDVTIIFETLTQFESNTCTTLKELKRLINEVDSNSFCGMLDLVAPFVQKEDPLDYIKELGDKIKHIHLVDSDSVSESHLIPGDGVMDLKSILKGIRDLNYSYGSTIELVTNYIDNPRKYSKLALERVKELI